MLQPMTETDQRAFLEAMPVPTLLLDGDLMVHEANAAFLTMTRRHRHDVLGHSLEHAFPRNPKVTEVDGHQSTRSSVARALATGQPDEVTSLRHDVEQDAGTGQFEERWWTVRNAPLLRPDGPPEMVLHTVTDITGEVHDREFRRRARQREVELLQRTQRLQSALHSRDRRVQELSAAEALVGRRLQGLAFVALELAAAETVDELTELVVVRGLTAMGCDGGGVAVRDDETQVVRLTISDTRLEGQMRQEMPLTTHLPSVVAAVVPEPIYLGDRDAGLAWGEEMALAYDTSGREAWASLPLVAEGRLLGSLTVAFDEPRTFDEPERDLLAAFAAQCAQALQRIQVREAERQAMRSSRLLSESLQLSLLTEPVEPDGVQVVVRYQPASREAYVGGDWYDAFPVRGGDTLLVIGDVAGHDRLATAAMAQVRGLLRGVAHSLDGSPAEVLGGLDHAMRDLDVDALVTALVVRVQAAPQSSSRQVRWSSAGHPPPLLLLPDGSCELLPGEPELLLGVEPDTARTDHQHEIPHGATLLLYTDGLVERRGESLTQGLEWLCHRVEALAALPLSGLCNALLAELPTDAEDDVAMLAIRVGDDTESMLARALPGTTRIRERRRLPRAPRGAGQAEVPARRSTDVALVLPLDLSAVRRARLFVRQHCLSAGLDTETAETVTLLTSETVTNAFIHGRSEARLRLRLLPDRVRLEIGDDNSRHPVRAERQDDALDGRGLAILELASSAWGIDDDDAGKVVWFEVAAEPTTTPPG